MKHDFRYNNGSHKRSEKNDRSMANTLWSTQEMRHHDFTNGIHGAMRARRGLKKATNSYRRRLSKKLTRDFETS